MDKFLRLIFLGMFCTLAATAHSEPKLNGVAIHTELSKEQFMGGIYLETPSKNAAAILNSNERKRIEIRVVKERLSTRRFKRMWIEGMAINASTAELEKQARNMADFSNMLKVKLTAGDIFIIDRQKDNIQILLNNSKLGEIEDLSFFDLLLRAWVGSVPLSSGFRSNILEGGKIDGKLLARFRSITPTKERIAAIQSVTNALTPQKPEEEIIAAAPPIKPTAPKITAPAAPKIIQPITSDEPPKIAAIKPTTPPQGENEEPSTKVEPEIVPTTPITTTVAFDENLLEDEEDSIDFTAENLLSQQLYIAKLKKWSHRFLKYPPRAFKRGRQGSVRISVTINRDGEVKSVETLEESKYGSLNKEAQNAAFRANPFPPIPDGISGEEFSFTVPVIFRIVDSN